MQDATFLGYLAEVEQFGFQGFARGLIYLIVRCPHTLLACPSFFLRGVCTLDIIDFFFSFNYFITLSPVTTYPPTHTQRTHADSGPITFARKRALHFSGSLMSPLVQWPRWLTFLTEIKCRHRAWRQIWSACYKNINQMPSCVLSWALRLAPVFCSSRAMWFVRYAVCALFLCLFIIIVINCMYRKPPFNVFLPQRASALPQLFWLGSHGMCKT